MENEKELEEMISSMIKGQIAFKGGFNSEEDINNCTKAIIFGLKLSTEEEL